MEINTIDVLNSEKLCSAIQNKNSSIGVENSKIQTIQPNF